MFGSVRRIFSSVFAIAYTYAEVIINNLAHILAQNWRSSSPPAHVPGLERQISLILA
jgi:hypothetical protein